MSDKFISDSAKVISSEYGERVKLFRNAELKDSVIGDQFKNLV